MFKFILTLLLLVPSLASAVSTNDVHNAVDVVARTVHVPVQIWVMPDMDDPMKAAWINSLNSCVIAVSTKNVNFLEVMLPVKPASEALEGLVAHEFAHCMEQRDTIQRLGVVGAKQQFADPKAVLQAEILGDIMAIMYWKQEYPYSATYFTTSLMMWRKAAAAFDKDHDTYSALVKVLPLIPNRFDYNEALNIRAAIK